jgi:uncharacterized membrane protein (UPF0127 family)
MRSFAFVLFFLCGANLARADDGAGLDQFPRDTLTIATASAKQYRFDVWLARTPGQQERGLMFVKQLPSGTGMLFVEEPPRVMSMWMKNTLIPLDMLFIDIDGTILYIRERAVPQSLAIIGYAKAVRAVLELRGGETAAKGIRVGDRIANGAFVAPRRAIN